MATRHQTNGPQNFQCGNFRSDIVGGQRLSNDIDACRMGQYMRTTSLQPTEKCERRNCQIQNSNSLNYDVPIDTYRIVHQRLQTSNQTAMHWTVSHTNIECPQNVQQSRQPIQFNETQHKTMGRRTQCCLQCIQKCCMRFDFEIVLVARRFVGFCLQLLANKRNDAKLISNLCFDKCTNLTNICNILQSFDVVFG